MIIGDWYGRPEITQMTPRHVQHGGGVELDRLLQDRLQCFALEPRGRLLPAKLAVLVHNLAHQLLNHLLPDDAVLLARATKLLRPAGMDFF